MTSTSVSIFAVVRKPVIDFRPEPEWSLGAGATDGSAAARNSSAFGAALSSMNVLFPKLSTVGNEGCFGGAGKSIVASITLGASTMSVWPETGACTGAEARNEDSFGGAGKSIVAPKAVDASSMSVWLATKVGVDFVWLSIGSGLGLTIVRSRGPCAGVCNSAFSVVTDPHSGQTTR